MKEINILIIILLIFLGLSMYYNFHSLRIQSDFNYQLSAKDDEKKEVNRIVSDQNKTLEKQSEIILKLNNSVNELVESVKFYESSEYIEYMCKGYRKVN